MDLKFTLYEHALNVLMRLLSLMEQQSGLFELILVMINNGAQHLLLGQQHRALNTLLSLALKEEVGVFFSLEVLTVFQWVSKFQLYICMEMGRHLSYIFPTYF